MDDQEQENRLIDGIYLATGLLLVLPFGLIGGGTYWFLRRGQSDTPDESTSASVASIVN